MCGKFCFFSKQSWEKNPNFRQKMISFVCFSRIYLIFTIFSFNLNKRFKNNKKMTALESCDAPAQDLAVCRFDFRVSVERRVIICFRMKFLIVGSVMMTPRRWKICVMCAGSKIRIRISDKINAFEINLEHLLISDANLVGSKWANSLEASVLFRWSRSCPNRRLANFDVYTEGFGSQIRTRSLFETNTLLPACNGIISSVFDWSEMKLMQSLIW